MCKNILCNHSVIQNVAKTVYLKQILPYALHLDFFFFLNNVIE